MSTKLLALPDELLTHIITYIDDSRLKNNRWGQQEITNSRPSLCALALVNRRLSAIACRILFEDITLYLRDGPHIPLDALRFAQCCEDNPAVVRRMRRLHIRWDFCTPAGWAWDLWEAIGLAKDLKVLRLESSQGHSDEKILPSIIEYLVTRLRSLEMLVINVLHLTLSPRLIWKICRSPSLQVLETMSPIREVDLPFDMVTTSDYSSILGEPGHEVPQTNLTSLCCSSAYSDPPALQVIVSNSPRLVRLQLNWPVRGKSQDGLILASGLGIPARPLPCVEPDVITETLLPCAKHLQELVLLNSTLRISEIEDPVVDLSWLRQLKRATLSIRLLRKTVDPTCLLTTRWGGYFPSHDWFEYLPTSLQALEIQFDSLRGLFWDVLELEKLDGYLQTIPRNRLLNPMSRKEGWTRVCSDFGQRLFEPMLRPELVTPNRLSWLTDTLKRRPGCLECLKSFRVVEVNTWNRRPGYWDRLDLAKTYPEAFGCPDLNFELIVRIPFGYVPPSFASMTSETPSEAL